jgi:hypothetical protein
MLYVWTFEWVRLDSTLQLAFAASLLRVSVQVANCFRDLSPLDSK